MLYRMFMYISGDFTIDDFHLFIKNFLVLFIIFFFCFFETVMQWNNLNLFTTANIVLFILFSSI